MLALHPLCISMFLAPHDLVYRPLVHSTRKGHGAYVYLVHCGCFDVFARFTKELGRGQGTTGESGAGTGASGAAGSGSVGASPV